MTDVARVWEWHLIHRGDDGPARDAQPGRGELLEQFPRQLARALVQPVQDQDGHGTGVPGTAHQLERLVHRVRGGRPGEQHTEPASRILGAAYPDRQLAPGGEVEGGVAGGVGFTPTGWPSHGHRPPGCGGGGDRAQRVAAGGPVQPRLDRHELVQVETQPGREPPTVVFHCGEALAPRPFPGTLPRVPVQPQVPGEGVPVGVVPGRSRPGGGQPVD